MNIISQMVEVHLFRIVQGEMEFLLLKRGEKEIYPGLWQMVSGRIEKDEKAYQTALREIKEETGLDVLHLWAVPNVNSFYSASSDELNFIPVFAAWVNSNAKVVISEEHSEFKWCLYEECRNLLVWEGQKKSVDILRDYYLNRKNDLDLVEITDLK